jgi:hypothetical protein
MCAENPERARRLSRGEVTRRARGETRALRTRDDVGKKKPLRLPSCCVTKSWLVLVQEASPLCSFGNHQARERRDGETPGEWNTPGAPLRALWHVSILPSLSSPLSPPLIENLCARIDDEGTRTRGCVAGSGVTPRAVRPRRARRVPSSRILRSVWVILGGAHRVARRSSRPSLWRGANRFQRGKTYRNDRHSTDSTHSTPLAEVVKEIGTELLGIRALRGLAQIHMTISL